jgi:RNA polymerase sigma factor (sigma-70 family)
MHIDHHFIEALRNNDPRGIREIYQRYSDQALRWVTQRGGAAADAKDIFQEAVMALYEKALDPSFVLTCPLGALLHVLYSRKWIDRLRGKNREAGVRKEGELRYTEEAFAEDTLTLAEDALAEQARQERLGRAFTELSELCRRMLTLLSNGVKPAEAAVQLELNSVDTLYRRKNACVQRWRAVYLEH